MTLVLHSKSPIKFSFAPFGLAALAAVVGACDGDLPLGVLIEAVAGLLGLDSDHLAVDLLPRLRRLIEQAFLQPSSGG